MSKELLRKKDWADARRWIARIAGVNMVAVALFIPPSEQSLNSATLSYNTGVTHENPVLEPKLLIAQPPPPPALTGRLTRDTGIDMQPCFDFSVCGVDLMIPFKLYGKHESIGYFGGDTLGVTGPFLKNLPPGVEKYRPQVMLRSNQTPEEGKPIIFDSAAGLDGQGIAPGLIGNEHTATDGISFPETDNVIMSYQSITKGPDPNSPFWYSTRAGLAWSPDGNHFELKGPTWENNADNTDPYQMWSMQRNGDWVDIISVRAGRQPGPMMLFRVPWDKMTEGDSKNNAYEYWNGSGWGSKEQAIPILQGAFGEPSLRKLSDGTWVMAYTDYSSSCPKVVTRTIKNADQGPEGSWSEPKEQLTCAEAQGTYGGYLWPDSTSKKIVMIISTWLREKGDDESKNKSGIPIRYDVSHLVGLL